MIKKFNKFYPQLVFAEQAGSVIALTNEQKLSLYKKSQKSGISTDILEEVYRRGYSIWNETFGQTAEQFAFERVNSFISGGFAAELDEDLFEACWKNYKQIGMKKKGNRTVPNCVPANESKETAEKQSDDPNKSSSRFEGTKKLTKNYKENTPGQRSKTLNKIKEVVKESFELEEATYKGKKVSLNKPFRTPGGPKKSAVYVDPDGDGKAKIVRFGDPKLSIKKDQPARKRSYCARSSGQGNLTKKDSANYWSRRAWDC